MLRLFLLVGSLVPQNDVEELGSLPADLGWFSRSGQREGGAEVGWF